MAAGGELLHLQVRNSFDSFDAGGRDCDGCFPPLALTTKRTRGDTLQRVAVGPYAAGGGVLPLIRDSLRTAATVCLTAHERELFLLESPDEAREGHVRCERAYDHLP